MLSFLGTFHNDMINSFPAFDEKKKNSDLGLIFQVKLSVIWTSRREPLVRGF